MRKEAQLANGGIISSIICSMDIQELTQRMNELVAHHGWYNAASPKPQLPRNLAISLSLEVAELLEHYQWWDQARDREGLREEMADVALYLLQLASIEGIDLEEAILDKIKMNYSRVWPSETPKSGDRQ